MSIYHGVGLRSPKSRLDKAFFSDEMGAIRGIRKNADLWESEGKNVCASPYLWLGVETTKHLTAESSRS